MAQLMAHQKEPVPDIRARCPDVPRSVADVLQRMMAKKADDRFATYDAMVDAMEDALHTPPSRITRGRVVAWGSVMTLGAVLAVLPSMLEASAPVEETVVVTPRPPRPPPPVVTPPPQPSARPSVEEVRPDEVELLVVRLKEETGQPRAKIMTSLARRQDPRGLKALQDILRDQKDADGPLAAVLLGEIGDQTATDALIAALESPRRATVLAAVDALVTLRDVRAVEPLKALSVRHDDTTVRTRARRAGALLFAVDGDN